MSKEEQIEFFKNMFSSLDIVEKNNQLIINNKILLIIALDKDIIIPENLFSYYSMSSGLIKKENVAIEEIAVICNKLSPESVSLLNKFNDIKFTIFSPVETYAILKKYNYFPQLSDKEKTQNITKSSFIKRSFVRKQAKTFFKCGALIYLSSLFIPFTTYYLITAGICVLLGGICLCFGEKELPISPLSKKILLEKTST